MFHLFSSPSPPDYEARLVGEMQQFIDRGLRQLETYLRTYADWQDFLRRREES